MVSGFQFLRTKKLYLVSSFVTDVKLSWRRSRHCQKHRMGRD